MNLPPPELPRGGGIARFLVKQSPEELRSQFNKADDARVQPAVRQPVQQQPKRIGRPPKAPVPAMGVAVAVRGHS